MPNRLIKESICTSENVDQLTSFQETFFYRLIVNCDDFGRMDARPQILASRLFPLKGIRLNQVSDSLRALAAADLIIIYEVNGKPYLQMNTWNQHQQIRAKKSKYPSPEEGRLITEDSTCNQLISNDIKNSRNPIQSNTESNPNPMREGKNANRFSPPSLDEIKAYCQERGNGIDPERFYAYYSARDWFLGKGQKMKNWKSTIVCWEKNEGRFNNGEQRPGTGNPGVYKKNDGTGRPDYSFLRDSVIQV